MAHISINAIRLYRGLDPQWGAEKLSAAGRRATSRCVLVAWVLPLLLAMVSLGSPAAAQTVALSGIETVLPISGTPAPVAVAVDASGDVFVSDTANNQVVRLTPSGNTYTQSTVMSGLVSPRGIALDSTGNVYIADFGGQQLYQVPPSGPGYGAPIPLLPAATYSPVDVTTNFPQYNYVHFTNWGDANEYAVPVGGGVILTNPVGFAGLSQPLGIVWHQTGVTTGNLFVTDYNLNELVVSTWNGVAWGAQQVVPVSGMSQPVRFAVDGSGILYIANEGSNQVFKVTCDAAYTTCTQSTVQTSPLNLPEGVAADAMGDIFIADWQNHRVLKEATAMNFGAVPVGTASSAATAYFNFTVGGPLGSIDVLTQGIAGLDFADTGTGTCTTGHDYNAGDSCSVIVNFTPLFAGARYGAIMLVANSGNVLATAYLSGTGTGAQINFVPLSHSGAPLSESVLPVTGTNLPSPAAIATDTAGDVYISDINNGQIVKLVPSGGGGYTQVTVASGLPPSISGVAVDGAGNVYFGDVIALSVYKVPWNGGSYGAMIPMPAGGYQPRYFAVDGSGKVFFADPTHNYVAVFQGGTWNALNLLGMTQATALAFDASGNLFVSDTVSNVVVELPAAFSPWTAAVPGWSGTPTTVVSSGLSQPDGLAVDASGSLYVADAGHFRVARVACTSAAVNPCTSWSGTATTVATSINPGDALEGVALDGAGNLYLNALSAPTYALKEDYADAPSLTFAATEVSATSSDSPQTVDIGNIGNQLLSMEGGAPAIPPDFDFTGSSCTTSLEVTGLVPAQFCGLTVTFNPWQTGNPLDESLALTDNNLNAGAPSYATQTILFSGVAYAQPLLSPSSATFSAVQTTTSNGWTFNLSNTGSVPITGITISITDVVGTGAHIPPSLVGVFAIQSTACGGTLSGDGQTVTGVTLGAYSSCNIVVTFSPPATGDASDSYTGNLRITDSSGGNPVMALLSGTGTIMQVDLSPGSFDFGSKTIGSTWPTQTATLTNASGGTLTVNSVVIATTTHPGGGASAAFTISATTCGDGNVAHLGSSFTLAQNAHCTITMSFAPDQGVGSYAGALTVSDNGSPATNTVTLTGAATGQSLFLSPTTITFSNQPAGSVSNPWTVTLNNSTNVGIAVNGIGISGFNPTDFGFTTDCTIPGTLAANSTCHIYVTFQPQSQGTFHGSLDVSYGSPSTTISVTLTGTGTAVTATLAPSQLNFGSVPDDGTSTATQMATLTNTSGGPLTITSAAVAVTSPAGSSAYSITATTCGTGVLPIHNVTLPAHQACTITVTFKPDSVNTFNGTLTVLDSAGTQTSSLKGVGTSVSTSGNVYFSPGSINFGNQVAGTSSSPWGMSLNNTGGTNITVSPSGVVLSDPTDFTLIPSNPCAGVTLGPGNSSCSFQVRFNPPVPWPPTETTLTVTPAPTLQPAAVVIDANGDIFVSDFGNDQVVELKPAGGSYTQTVVVNGSSSPALVSPRGLALDSSGNLYIADNGKILKVPCPGGVCGAPALLVPEPGQQVQDVAFDPYGYLWFTLWGNSNVWSVPAGGGAPTNYSGTYFASTPFSQPLGLAWQTTVNTPGAWQGNLFIADYNNNSITEWTWNGGAWVLASPQPAASISTPGRMAVDSAGDLYIADTGHNRVVQIPWTGSAWGTQFTVPTSALNQPVGVGLDGGGSLYIADWQNHRVLKETMGSLGVKSATLSATYTGGGGGTVTAPLTGTSVGSSVAVSPSSLDFGNVIQGGTSPAKTVTVTDTGNGPVSIISIGVTDSTNFTISGGTCTTSTILTSVHPSCTIQVQFTPHAVQSYTGATLRIGDTATGSPQTVGLTGTGVSNAPSAYFSPSSINFGNQTLGSTSSPWGMTLNNNGSVAFNPSGVTVSVGSSDFSIPAGTNHCATVTSLAPGSSCSFQVTFTPSVGGTRNGTIAAGGSSPLNTITASLTGSGNGATISISPSSLNFGNVVQNAGPTAAQYVTVTNTSGGILTIANPSGIVVTSPFNLATGSNACANGTQLTGAGASCKIYVTFSPTSLGNLSGTLTVASNASNGSQTVSLYGNGVAVGSHIISAGNYTLSADPASLTLQAGQTGTATFTLAPLNGYAGTVALTCGDLPFGVTCTFAPSSLTADGNGTLQTSKLTITTAGNGQSAKTTDHSPRPSGGIALASLLLWPGLILGGILAWHRKKLPSQIKLVLFAFVLLFTFVGATGCTGIHFNSSPVGTHVLSITANASTSAGGGAATTDKGTFTLTITQ